MSKSLEIEFLKQKLRMIDEQHKLSRQRDDQKWRQLYNKFNILHRIIVKENLIGTKYFCSCSDCAINVFYSTTSIEDMDEDRIDKKAFCECHDADIIPIEIFYKWYPNQEQEPPIYNNE